MGYRDDRQAMNVKIFMITDQAAVRHGRSSFAEPFTMSA